MSTRHSISLGQLFDEKIDLEITSDCDKCHGISSSTPQILPRFSSSTLALPLHLTVLPVFCLARFGRSFVGGWFVRASGVCASVSLSLGDALAWIRKADLPLLPIHGLPLENNL